MSTYKKNIIMILFFVNTPTPTAPFNFVNIKDMEKLVEFTFETKNTFSPKNSIKKNDKFC
jgi:hypothetical protein